MVSFMLESYPVNLARGPYLYPASSLADPAIVIDNFPFHIT